PDRGCDGRHLPSRRGYPPAAGSATPSRLFLNRRPFPPHLLFRGTWPHCHVSRDHDELDQCFTRVHFTLGILHTDFARCNLQQKLASSVSHLLLEIFTHLSLLPQRPPTVSTPGPPSARRCPAKPRRRP